VICISMYPTYLCRVQYPAVKMHTHSAYEASTYADGCLDSHRRFISGCQGQSDWYVSVSQLSVFTLGYVDNSGGKEPETRMPFPHTSDHMAFGHRDNGMTETAGSLAVCSCMTIGGEREAGMHTYVQT